MIFNLVWLPARQTGSSTRTKVLLRSMLRDTTACQDDLLKQALTADLEWYENSLEGLIAFCYLTVLLCTMVSLAANQAIHKLQGEKLNLLFGSILQAIGWFIQYGYVAFLLGYLKSDDLGGWDANIVIIL